MDADGIPITRWPKDKTRSAQPEGLKPEQVWDPDTNPRITPKNLASFLIQTQEHRLPVQGRQTQTAGWARRFNPADPDREVVDDIEQFVRKHSDAKLADRIAGRGTISDLLRSLDPDTPPSLVQQVKDLLESPRPNREALAQSRAFNRSTFAEGSKPQSTWKCKDADGQLRVGTTKPQPGSYKPTPEDYAWADAQLAKDAAPVTGKAVTARVQRGQAPAVTVKFKSPNDKLALMGGTSYKGRGFVKNAEQQEALKTVQNRLKLHHKQLTQYVTQYKAYVQRLASSAPKGENVTIEPMSLDEFISSINLKKRKKS